MKHIFTRTAMAASAIALTFSLAACGGSEGSSSGGEPAELGSAPVELTMAAWNIQSTPEFQALADAFMEAHPNVKINVNDYPAKDYDTLLTTDLSSGKGPDVYPVKNMRKFNYYQENGQMEDLSELAKDLEGDENISLDFFKIEDSYFGLPFRQDNEVIYYNKSLFDKAGVEYPDGNWTWDDYTALSKELTEKLAAAGETAKGSYLHIWPIMQGFALAQTEGADPFTGNLDYLKPYYETALKLQDDGSQESFSTAQAQSLTYQAQFGTEKAAMMPMGTWYIATLMLQQESGDAHKFEWGMAPVPQRTSATFDKPVTYGMSTPMAVNPNIDGEKKGAALEFAKFSASEEAAKLLASKGIVPAYLSPAVADILFGLEGAPQDDLSRKALTGQSVNPEFPVDPDTAAMTQVLKDYHSAIMTGDQSIDDALKAATADLKAQGVVRK
ncbi:MAG: extracellular solute-binding protein [Actinomycetaceae bacterium]|nr:extracellular solute-binding protein [Actinomycetaceae bacterium]